jgi:hypothetical protein
VAITKTVSEASLCLAHRGSRPTVEQCFPASLFQSGSAARRSSERAQTHSTGSRRRAKLTLELEGCLLR